jgi:hypothetical protein
MADNKLQLIDNYIYFGHLDKWAVLPQYPDSVSDSMQSKFSETNALSRTAPVYSYVQSGPRTVNLTISIHRDMMESVNVNISNLRDNVLDLDSDYTDTLINYLQACALPRYNIYSSGAKAVEPPWVALRLGNAIFIKGVITSNISVEWKKPILSDGKYAQCSLQLTISETDPYDADTVAEVGGFRGLTKTFKNGIYKE